jgi:hypothetical protein
MDNKMTSANLIDILAGTREISDEELIEMLQGMADEIPGDDTQVDTRFAKLIVETAINRLTSRAWKPIDDETPHLEDVIVASPNHKPVLAWHGDGSINRPYSWLLVGCDWGLHFTPTHWMPPPTLPKEKDEQRQT